MEDILVKIREIIVDQFGVNPEEVTADMPISDLSADSLDLVEMVMALEETFDILETIYNINDLENGILEYLQ